MNSLKVADDICLVTVTFNSAFQSSNFSETAQYFDNVIIVDNASTDSTVEEFKEKIPQAKIIKLKENNGFGAANNIGFDLAKTEFVLFMNPDCKISSESVAELRRLFDVYSLAVMVGPKIVRLNGIALYTFKWDFRRKFKKLAYPEMFGPVSAKNIAGCCFMVRSIFFLKIGKFDKKLFMYWEEDDLGIKATQLGYDVISTPNATAMHEGDSSTLPSFKLSIFKSYHFTKSRLIIEKKYVSEVSMKLKALKIFIFSPIAIIFFLVLCRKRYLSKWIGRLLASAGILVTIALK